MISEAAFISGDQHSVIQDPKRPPAADQKDPAAGGCQAQAYYLTLSISFFSFPKNLPVGCSAGGTDDGIVGAVITVKVFECVDVDGVDAVFAVLTDGSVPVLVIVGTIPAGTPGCAAFRQVTYAGLHQ
jgi:hypothetical protein